MWMRCASSAARMGAGYFPMLLGMLLALLGGAIVFKALVIETEHGGKTGPWVWRPVACIVLADLAFALLVQGVPGLGLPPMGLVAAVFALTLIATRAGPVFRWKEALLMAALLAAASWLLLVVVLKLPLQAWPALPSG